MNSLSDALLKFLNWLDRTNTITSARKFNFLTHLKLKGLDAQSQHFIQQSLHRAEHIHRAEIQRLEAKQKHLQYAQNLNSPMNAFRVERYTRTIESRLDRYRNQFQDLTMQTLHTEEAAEVQTDLANIQALKAKFA